MSSLNHPKVTILTRKIAAELGLELRFVDFIFAAERPDCFRFWCEPIPGSWTCFVPDEVHVAYPLWSCNADQTLLMLSSSGKSYAIGYHDNPDIELISRTSQGLLADLINRISESEASDEEIQRAADFCGFRFLMEYLAFIDRPTPPGTSWDSWWQTFIDEVDAKSS